MDLSFLKSLKSLNDMRDIKYNNFVGGSSSSTVENIDDNDITILNTSKILKSIKLYFINNKMYTSTNLNIDNVLSDCIYIDIQDINIISNETIKTIFNELVSLSNNINENIFSNFVNIITKKFIINIKTDSINKDITNNINTIYEIIVIYTYYTLIYNRLKTIYNIYQFTNKIKKENYNSIGIIGNNNINISIKIDDDDTIYNDNCTILKDIINENIKNYTLNLKNYNSMVTNLKNLNYTNTNQELFTYLNFLELPELSELPDNIPELEQGQYKYLKLLISITDIDEFKTKIIQNK